MEANQNKSKLFLWAVIGFAVVMGCLFAGLSESLVMDDTAFYAFIHDYINREGFWKGMLDVLRLQNLAEGNGEFRTYCLSRTLQGLLLLLFNDNVKVYSFIIASTHVLSGLLVFGILNELLGIESRNAHCCAP